MPQHAIQQLFVDLRLADTTSEGDGSITLHLESMSADVLAINVSIPSEHLSRYVKDDELI